MHILFVDKSGTPPGPGKQEQRYFVVGGLIVPEDVWHRLKDAMLGMKLRRKIRGELKWRYFAPENDQPGNPMRKLSRDTKDEIRSELYRIITREKSIKIIALVCSIPAAYGMASVNGADDIYKLTYKTVTERFQYFLQDISRTVGRREHGLIIADHRGSKDDKSLRAHHQMLLYSDAGFTSRYNNLIEGLLLQPSNLSVGIQLADMVSGAVWRKYERNDDRWFNLLEPSVRRSISGNIEGYGIIKVPKFGWI